MHIKMYNRGRTKSSALIFVYFSTEKSTVATYKVLFCFFIHVLGDAIANLSERLIAGNPTYDQLCLVACGSAQIRKKGFP